MNPSPGRIVHYTLTDNDVQRINDRRNGDFHRVKEGEGNPPRAGGIVPLIIVTVDFAADEINGQAFLDGNDTLWLTSVKQTPTPEEFARLTPGRWYEPPRV